MHADEHREAAKRERLEIEKSTGKGDCRGAARAPHWPVFIGVITLLQALCTWKPCRIEPGSSPIVTLSPLPGPASKSISPSEHGPNLKSQLHSHRIDFCLLYPCPLYHYQAISVTALVLHPAILSSPPNAQATSAIRHLRLASNHRLSTILLAVFLVGQNRSVIRFLE